MPRVQRIILILFLVIAPVAMIIWIGYFVEKQNLTSNEVVLSNVLIVIFSIIASTVVAHFYFESSNKRSLGIYAKKAAEKVSNLSNQLTKLSFYLQQEEKDLSLSPEEILLIKEERIQGAVHIIETLKSVNDRSLSDWRGIVPDEDIEEAQQNIEEQADSFKQILDEYRVLLEPHQDNAEGDETDEEIRQDISNIKTEIQRLATSIIGTPVKKPESSVKKESVSLPCPQCGAINNYRQRAKANSRKQFTCKACYEPLVSIWEPVNGFELSKNPTPPGTPKEVDEETIQQIKAALPDQPWPKGISKEVQKELGLSASTMKRAIFELIRRGDFKAQQDGVLYDLIDPSKVKK